MPFDSRDMAIIRRSSLFAGLDDGQFRALLPRPRIVQLPRGRTLFERGEPAVACFVMIDGWLKLVRRDGGGPEVVIHVFGPHETFAEALIVPGAQYPGSAVTVTDVRLLRVDTSDLRTAIAADPRLALTVLSGCYRHLHALVDQMERERGWPAKRRVAGFLHALCDAEQGAATIELPFERTLVAARLGMTVDTLARAVTGLASFGIAADGPRIHIADVAALGRFVRSGR